MASILDFLRKKNPNLSLDDARSAMGMAPDAQFNMFGEHVPVEEPIEQTKAPMLSPLKKEVPAEPQIYNEDYDPSADLDIERNPVERPQVQQAPKAPVVQKDTAGMNAPVGSKVQSKPMSSDEFESKPEEDPLEKQYAKEDAEAQAAADAVSNDSEGHHLANIKTGFEQSSAPQGPMTLADRFKAAQKAKADAEDTAMWSKIGAQLGGAIGHQSKDVVQGNMNLADMVASRGGRPMQQLEQELAFQSKDPNSDYSQAARNFLKKNFNVDIPDTVSIEQLNGSMMKPLLENFKKQADFSKEVFKQGQMGARTQAGIQSKEKIAENRLDEMSRFHDITANAMQQRLGLMAKTAQDKNSRALISQVQQGVNKLSSDKNTYVTQIQRANNILHTVGLPSDITDADVDSGKYDAQLNKLGRVLGNEVGMEAAGLLMRGQKPSVATMNKILPSNLKMTETEYKDFITGKMNEAKQAPYLKAMLKTSLRIKKQNEDYFDTQKKSLLGPLGHKVDALGDESLKKMYDSALQNMYGNTSKAKSSSSLPNPTDVHNMSSDELDALEKQLEAEDNEE